MKTEEWRAIPGYEGTHEVSSLGRVRVLDRIDAAGAVQGRTHCPHGHEYTEGNTYWRPSGRRACRECRRRESMNRKAA